MMPPGAGAPTTSGGGAAGPTTPGVTGGPVIVGIPGGLPYWGRLSTSQRRLDPTWDFVNPQGDAALPFAEAFEKIAMGDPRPILLLRDCCHSDRDLTKISTFTDDERVALAMNWFHIVRLNKDVVKPNHPLHALMGDKNPHMVIFTNDGKDRADMVFVPTSNALWSEMLKGLKRDYKNPADEAISKWRKVLTEFDRLDNEWARTKGEDWRKNGSDQTLAKKLEDLDEKRDKLAAEEKKIKDLGFRDPNKKAPTIPVEPWREELLKGKAPAKPGGGD